MGLSGGCTACDVTTGWMRSRHANPAHLLRGLSHRGVRARKTMPFFSFVFLLLFWKIELFFHKNMFLGEHDIILLLLF